MSIKTLLTLTLFVASTAQAGGGGGATLLKAFECQSRFKEGERLGQELLVSIHQNMNHFGGSRGYVSISGIPDRDSRGRALFLSDVERRGRDTVYVFRSDATYILSNSKSFYFSLTLNEKDEPAFSFLNLDEKLADGTLTDSSAVLSCSGRFLD